MLHVLAMLQGVAAFGPPLVTDPRLRAVVPCQRKVDEITVCAKGDQPYRLKPDLAPLPEPGLPKAETSALGGRVAVETERVGVGGFPSNRAMVRMKWKF
ncbi:hypothetical protein [Polymorphobacter fuscus]|uniref:Uncharacterized protein n=1 Tax=Sandarakinorhabdus fusca TaxID=1439888 RepID=A0A7C9GU39_9SPHN|nr:hypothetical protein [Polymorphobacter fuscus]KAB7647462.1 hypothetical protein F9290_05530 [Polymorphobacter fuscus]MQT16718.1 hypothetical protein [Polymorphobacter fuscus]NJC09295.1 hypothetical protein [Polymorphobacter fuscus]